MIKAESAYFIMDSPSDPGIKNILNKGINNIKSFVYKMVLELANPNIGEKNIMFLFAPFLRMRPLIFVSG